MKGAITLGEGCIDNQPSRLANCSSIEMNTKIGENPRPSELVGLSFIESREKDKEKPHKRSNHNAALLSLTLAVAPAGTLYLVILDAMALAMTRDAHVIADVAGHTALSIFFGFRSRTLIVFLVSFLCAILFFTSYLFLIVCRCVLLVTPKSN